MPAKIDYKRQEKQLYVPKSEPAIVDVPAMTFIAIDGEGDPNGPAFAQETEALYSVSYAVKMSYKGSDVPEGYYEYTVYPLEGVWSLVDLTRPATDKTNLKYTLMIRQPSFLTTALFRAFVDKTAAKKPNPQLARLSLVDIADGLSCQMMHLGSYDDEPASFGQMEAFCAEAGYARMSKEHREIYLSDPRKTAPDKLRTVLRFAVAKA
ncbi:GyrI-like domain-containing protein [Cohnella sp. 56]|uniref:GyrI-like domain-containing protein n=1 Tax=Cohnella sp. 56 TaxID=3113722 RepID=UPI0030E887AD